MRMSFAVGCALTLLLSGASAAPKMGMRFWNLTGETLSEVSLAPAGTEAFGANQCANDKDGTVEFDEQVAVTGVAPGRYDLRLTDIHGRTCFAKAVKVEAGAVFSVQDKELTDCAR